MSEKKSKICSFMIDVNSLKAFLRYLKASGIDASGSKVTLINDCILRFDDNSKMFSIVSDAKRGLVVQIKVEISNLKNPIPIPIEIGEMEKWLSSFDDSDEIKVLYEKGIIGLKNVEKREYLDFDLTTDVIFSTKREDTISCDLITNLDYGDGESDKKNLQNIQNLGHSIYEETDGGIKLFFGVELTNMIELSSRQLKKVISDGERIENRIYPFSFEENKLKITIKNADKSKKNRVARDLYSKKYEVKNPFSVSFSNRLTYAVNNISGYVRIYAEKESPMFMKSVDSEERGLEVVYLITPY